ncbi:exonuclease domain-containing protein [Streptomyces nondiastaticus]|uniref:Exonuclease domain-containing protein n=1 Tax=Streptomyces nondiastaticus TaxID=3154512 RepID=A0ABW6U5C2_9ACTN
MTAPTWPDGRLVAFDTETTGVAYDSDRIVAAAVVETGGGLETKVNEWLIDPGMEIPEAATAVHGITTERARAEGAPAAAAVEEITAMLASLMGAGHPLVVFNARFDLTLLDRECRRHDLVPLTDRLPGGQLSPVIDPMVIDRQVDCLRPGSRKLPDLCRHWQVRHDGPHTPAADALAAARLAWRIGHVFPRLGAMDLRALHALQTEQAAKQAVSLQRYLRRTDSTAYVEPAWPYVPQTINGTEGNQG